MKQASTVVVLGTFDSKGEEHLFLKQGLEARGLRVLTINVGTKGPSPFEADFDLRPAGRADRDLALRTVIDQGRSLVGDLFRQGRLSGAVSAGGGTGTYISTSIMKALPLGIPKIMISTVASRDMSGVVGTRDITMMHSVGDLLGVNAVSGRVLDQAAGALAGMVDSAWQPDPGRKRIAMTMFGFITEAAERIRELLMQQGHEVVAFHANGTGGLAMEELAAEGYFDAVLDLATHELADSLYPGGYCRLIGPGRLETASASPVPRLVIPGGLDCGVLEFTRETIPEEFKGHKIFFYDFRSAVRLCPDKTRHLARDLADRLNRSPGPVRMLIPMKGWSEADREGGPLHDPEMTRLFTATFKSAVQNHITVEESESHINDQAFARTAADKISAMI